MKQMREETPEAAPPQVKDTLWAITGEWAEIENLLEAAEAAETADDAAVYETEAQARFEALVPRLQEKAAGFAAIIRHNDVLAQAARAEEQRLARLRKRRENTRDRLKEWLKTGLERIGLLKVESTGFRVTVRTVGGNPKVTHDGRTPVPPDLAKPVLVDVARLEEVLLAGEMDARFERLADCLAYLGITEPLEPAPAKVLEWVKAHGGEVPAGFSVERGTYLSIE